MELKKGKKKQRRSFMNRNIIIGGANGLLRDLDEQTSLGFKRKMESTIKN